MMTIFLWAVLITAILFLIVIASPLRFGVRVSYSKPRQPEFEAWLSYVHPAVLTYKYSSDEEQPILAVFGRAWGRKRRKGSGVDNIDNADNIDGVGDVNNVNNIGNGGNINDNSVNNDISSDDMTVNSNPAGDGVNTSNINENAAVDNTADINNTNDAAVDNASDINNTSDKNSGNGGDSGKKQKSPKISIITRIRQRIDAVRQHRLYRLATDKIFVKKFFRWLLRGVSGIFKFVSIDRLRLRASIGLRDPAALGKLYGYFIAAASALELRGGRGRVIDLAMEPVFTEERLEIDCEMAGGATPSVALWHSLVMLFTFPYWRAWRVAWSGKKRGRGRAAKPSSSPTD